MGFMSRTRRIYNNPRLKKTQRFYWDAPEIVDERGGVIIPINNVIVGFPYTKYRQLCMGRCSMCRDAKKEQRTLRKQRKEQFRFDLMEEMKNQIVEDFFNTWDRDDNEAWSVTD